MSGFDFLILRIAHAANVLVLEFAEGTVKNPTRLNRSVLFLAALLFLACIAGQNSVDISSTSVSTGNPVGLTFHFEKGSHPIALTGTMDIYAATQIPVPGYRPDPLLRIRLDNTDTARLDATVLAAIPDTLWLNNTGMKDSLLNFNVVLTGDSEGAILQGFSFDKRRGLIISPATSEGERTFHAEVSSLVDYVGHLRLDSTGLSTHRFDFYLFIFGTGYYAKGIGHQASEVDTILFTIPKLPAGQHDAFVLLFPNPAYAPLSHSDSTAILNLESPFRTDSDSLRVVSVFKLVKLPVDYWTH